MWSADGLEQRRHRGIPSSGLVVGLLASLVTKCHPAGAALHVTMSLWQQTALKVQIAPDRESERRAYLSEVDRAGGFFAVRIKSQGNPSSSEYFPGASICAATWVDGWTRPWLVSPSPSALT